VLRKTSKIQDTIQKREKNKSQQRAKGKKIKLYQRGRVLPPIIIEKIEGDKLRF